MKFNLESISEYNFKVEIDNGIGKSVRVGNVQLTRDQYNQLHALSDSIMKSSMANRLDRDKI